MANIIEQFSHMGAIIDAVIAFTVFYLTQVWKSIRVDKSYGEQIMAVKQPKKEMLTLLFIVIVGIAVIYRLFVEYQTPNDAMPESYYQVLMGAVVLVAGLILFIVIRTISPTKLFTNGVLVHDYGYVSWDDIKSIDKTPKGQFQAFLVKPRQFKGKTFYINYDAAQEEELITIFRKYIY